MKRMIHSEKAPKPLGAYSQGVVAGGFIFVSGQLPIDPQTGQFVEQDIKKQTRQVFRNIEQILAAEGAELKDVVKISAFLFNLEDFQGMNEVFQEFFTDHFPARTTSTVKAFPQGVLVEIDVIALEKSIDI